VRLVPVTVLILTQACGSAGPDPAAAFDVRNTGDVLFLVQHETPLAVMDALHTGRVAADGSGCLRIDGATPTTVVWPKGFALDGRTVRDERGRSIGRLGGGFRLGGGEVPLLHDGIPLSTEARAAAEERCPGRFWIVGDIPR
jgi:hypothetical protein